MSVVAWRFPCALGAAAMVLSGCRPVEAERPEVVRPVKTMVVTAGDGLHTRVLPGKVEASKKAELAFQVSGPLVSLPVKEGQRVKKGELIAQIRKADFESRANALKAELDRARIGLRALRQGARPEEQRQLEAQLRAAQATLEKTRAEYDRSRTLVATGATSRTQFDADAAAYRVAQEQHKAAQDASKKAPSLGKKTSTPRKPRSAGSKAGWSKPLNWTIRRCCPVRRRDRPAVRRSRIRTSGRKQPIVKFQDVDEIDIAVDVPETVMAADLRSADIVQMTAEFSAAPGLRVSRRHPRNRSAGRSDDADFRVRVGHEGSARH